MMKRRYALRDDWGERIKSLLPGREDTVGMTAKDNRLVVEGVLYCLPRGHRVAEFLSDRFGDCRVVHARHMHLSKSYMWQKVLKYLAQDADNNYLVLDSTMI